jgi:hypothetical protein
LEDDLLELVLLVSFHDAWQTLKLLKSAENFDDLLTIFCYEVDMCGQEGVKACR